MGTEHVDQVIKEEDLEFLLQRLKRLWEKDLITDEEYAGKKKEILDRL